MGYEFQEIFFLIMKICLFVFFEPHSNLHPITKKDTDYNTTLLDQDPALEDDTCEAIRQAFHRTPSNSLTRKSPIFFSLQQSLRDDVAFWNNHL